MLSAAFFDGGEGDNYKRRNASRPSVIYFHGHSDKDGVREQTACPNNVFSAKTSRANSCSVGVRCEDGDEERSEELQDLGCNFEPSNECYLPKRHRTSFTSFQLKRLEEEFDQDAYIIGMKRWRLADELEVPEKQIKIWFQNRRTKLKKDCSKSV